MTVSGSGDDEAQPRPKAFHTLPVRKPKPRIHSWAEHNLACPLMRICVQRRCHEQHAISETGRKDVVLCRVRTVRARARGPYQLCNARGDTANVVEGGHGRDVREVEREPDEQSKEILLLLPGGIDVAHKERDVVSTDQGHEALVVVLVTSGLDP